MFDAIAIFPVCLWCWSGAPPGRVVWPLGLCEGEAALLERGAAVLKDMTKAVVVTGEFLAGAQMGCIVAK